MKKLKKVLVVFVLISLLFLSYIVPFGSVKANTKPLVIVLDPGHGGIDPGAVNNSLGLKERDINFKIAQYLRAELLKYDDVEVYLTHETFASNIKLELYERANIAQNYNADILISLHINATGGRGAEVYVTRDPSETRYNQESTKLGNSILKNLSNLGIANRGVKTRKGNTIASEPKQYYYGDFEIDYYGMIRYPRINGIPGIIVEHCFIDNYDDAQFINSDSKLLKIAQADAKGIVEHYGLKLKDPTRVKSVSVDKTNAILIEGNTVQITPTVSPSTAVNKKVTWSSSDASIAKVDANGLVTGLKPGRATITCKTQDNAKTATTTIEVKELKVELDKEEVTVLEGNKTQLNVELSVDVGKTFQWISSDPTIATVDQNGIVTAVKEGTAIITVSIDNKKDTAKINVKKLATGQKIEIKSLKQEYSVLTRIKEQTKVEDFIKNFEVSSDLEVIIKNEKGNVLTNTDIITTQTNIYIADKTTKEVIQQYETIVFGDINKDGKISAADYVMIKNHIMETSLLSKKLINVADVSRDKKLSAADYVLIKNHIMNGTNLNIE